MAVAGDTNLVTGAQGVITSVVAAAAGTTSIHVVNESGQRVAFFVDAETIPFEWIDGFGHDTRLDLVGAPSTLALKAVCEAGPLRLRVTAWTA